MTELTFSPEQQAAIDRARAKREAAKPAQFTPEQQAALDRARAKRGIDKGATPAPASMASPEKAVTPAQAQEPTPDEAAMAEFEKFNPGKIAQYGYKTPADLPKRGGSFPPVGVGGRSGMAPGGYVQGPGLSSNQGLLLGMADTATFGWGQEINAGLEAAFTDKTYDEAYAPYKAAEEDAKASGTYGAGRVMGALTPGGLGARLATGAASTLGRIGIGAGLGAVSGGVTASGQNDENRVGAGLLGAGLGAVIGGAVPAAVAGGTKAFQKVFGKAVEKPTVEGLEAAKSLAYKAVDDSGEMFSKADLKGLYNRVVQDVKDGNYFKGTDQQTNAVLGLLKSSTGKELKIGQLDRLRQNFFKRFEAAPNETGILDAIDAIDDLILSRASTSSLMDAARAANSVFKKAETLDLAFKKADLQTAATGSGGNILNKYRQAVTAILTNPKRAKWFSEAEKGAMEEFVKGSAGQNFLRKIGKLAPGGNGLMTALNLGAVWTNPAMLGVTVGASAAKGLSDGATSRAASDLVGRMGGAAPAAATAVSPLAVGAGVAAAQDPYAGLIERYAQ